jgi:hypothetical protein
VVVEGEEGDMRWSGLVLGVVLATSPAFGKEMTILGAGSQPCSSLNSRTIPSLGPAQNSITLAAFNWAQGFLSATNMMIGVDKHTWYDDLPDEEQWAHIAKYCRENPSQLMVDAVLDLAKRLTKSSR